MAAAIPCHCRSRPFRLTSASRLINQNSSPAERYIRTLCSPCRLDYGSLKRGIGPAAADAANAAPGAGTSALATSWPLRGWSTPRAQAARLVKRKKKALLLPYGRQVGHPYGTVVRVLGHVHEALGRIYRAGAYVQGRVAVRLERLGHLLPQLVGHHIPHIAQDKQVPPEAGQVV